MPYYYFLLHACHHVVPVVQHFRCLKFNLVMKHYYATHPFFNLACKGA